MTEEVEAQVTAPATAAGPDVHGGDELPRGATLGRYVILKRLGRGGMGIVYLAFDGELDRRVAIKVLSAKASERHSAGGQRARLLREAQAMAKVSHPNVIAVHDVGTFGDEVFVAMEYVAGTTLRIWVRAKPRSVREVLAAYAQAGRGLEAAHAAGILHRDFKPENVLVDESGRVRVLDFGLARLDEDEIAKSRRGSDAALEDTGAHSRGALETPLTRVGEVMGTPAYMPPEQLTGEKVTARSDQFAFCVALYEALYGHVPFEGNTVHTRVASIVEGRMKPEPRGVRVPRGVRAALLRGMKGKAEERFASMGELLRALERGAQRPARQLATAGAAVAVLAVVAFARLRPAPPKLCTGAQEALGPAWNAQRADELRAAFVASGNARGDDAFQHTRTLLDRYAASWVAMHTDACTATRIRGDQSEEGLDLRMACLKQRQRELQATVDLLGHANAKTVDKAVEAAAHLTPVDTCADPAALRAPFAPPNGKEQASAVDDLRKKVANVTALEHAGHWADALPLATADADEATRVGYGPLRAEALFAQGYAERALDKPTDVTTLFEAALQAERSRYDTLVARAYVEQVQGYIRRSSYDEASRAVKLADAAIVRADDNEALRADLLRMQGWIAYDQSDQKNALDFAQRALEIRNRVLGPEHPDTLIARSDVADRLWDEGELDRALRMYEELHRARVSLLGEGHPATVRSLNDIVDSNNELGEYGVALEASTKAMALATLPVALGFVRTSRGITLVGMGRVEEGVAVFEEGIQRLQALDRPQGITEFRSNFARALVQRGANAEAETYAALAMAQTSRERRESLGVHALCRQRRGDSAGALTEANAALAIPERPMGERADLIPLLARGQAYLSMHRDADALADLERAFAIGAKNKGDRAVRADAGFALARALVATGGDHARAAELASRAARELTTSGLEEQAKAVSTWMAAHGLE